MTTWMHTAHLPPLIMFAAGPGTITAVVTLAAEYSCRQHRKHRPQTRCRESSRIGGKLGRIDRMFL
jgi:hypothetical protein